MFIYNETTKPYSFKKGDDVNVVFRKVTNNKKGNAFKAKKNHVLVHNSVLGLSDVEQRIRSAVRTKGVERITDKESIMYFSKKDLSPFITSLTSGKAATLMATINLKTPRGERKLVEIDNPYIFLLQAYVMAGELSFVASFVDKSKDLTLTFLEGDKLVKYSFRHKNGKFTLRKTKEDNKDGVTAPAKYKFNIYVPTRTTAAILCYSQDREDLEKLIPEENRVQHHIVEVSNRTIEEELIHLKQDNYGVATLFINKKELDDEAQKMYRRLINLSENHLRVVVAMFNDGRVKKLKY